MRSCIRHSFLSPLTAALLDGRSVDEVFPVEGVTLRRKLDGTDSGLTRVGGNNYRQAPSSTNTDPIYGSKGTWYDGNQVWNDDGNSGVVAIGTNPFSWSFWVNFSNTSVNGRFISTGTANAGATEIELFHDGTGRARFRFNNTAFDIVSTADAADGQWHHIVVTMTGPTGTMKGYLDGVEVNSIAAPNYNILDSGNLRYGGRPTGDLKVINAGIQDIVFFDNKVLTPAEVTTIYQYAGGYYPTQNTAIAYFDPSNLDTVTSSGGLVSNLADITSNGNDLVQASSSAQLDRDGEINNVRALLSTTTGKFMQNTVFPIPASGNLMVHQVCEITGQAANVASSIMSMDPAWQLQANNGSQFDGRLETTGIGGSVSLVDGPYTGPDIWSIEFNFDESLMRVYVNGDLKASTSYTTKIGVSQHLRVFANRNAARTVYGNQGDMIFRENCDATCFEHDLGYLAWKYFPTTDLVAGNPILPSGHPYKLNPPPTVGA